MSSNINVTVCQLCVEDFDTEITWQEANHRLPVSCSNCPNTVCYQCYLSLQRMQKRNIDQFGGIRCPRCSAERGFASQNPVYNRALAALLKEIKSIIQATLQQEQMSQPIAPPSPKNQSTKKVPLSERRRAASPTAALSPKSPAGNMVSAASFPVEVPTEVKSKKKAAVNCAPTKAPPETIPAPEDSRSETSASRSLGSRRTEIQIKKKALPIRYIHMNPCGFGSTD